jgi:hypothetical protein
MQVAFNRKDRTAKLPEAITCIQRLLMPLGNTSRLEFYKSKITTHSEQSKITTHSEQSKITTHSEQNSKEKIT